MAVEIPFCRDITFEYGRLEAVSPLIRRIIARNPGPFTYKGTGTYVVGHGEVAVIDPGPLDEAHIEALLLSLRGETITHILVTHTHMDHSPAARVVKASTNAPTFGFGPHGASLYGSSGEEGGDRDFVPDEVLTDGSVIKGKGWTIEAVHTPGHTSNHLCFGLLEERALFSGDHVMGWSTSVISPPDGDMGHYLASLEKLLGRDDERYWPTHGPAIAAPKPFVSAFIAHRREREQAIMAALQAGGSTIDGLVSRIYLGLAPGLVKAAGRSLMAHLLDLMRRGLVDVVGLQDGNARPGFDSKFTLTEKRT